MAFLKRKKDPFKEIQSCLQKRDYRGALGAFQLLFEKDPKNTQIRLRYADTLVLAGSKEEAIRQYRRVADELAEAGFTIRAIAINKKIVQLDPRQSDVHEKLAAMNEERTKSLRSRSSLPPQVLMPPTQAAPSQDKAPPAAVTTSESPAAGVPADRAEPGPRPMSLEESVALEFGEDAGAYASSPEPSAEDIGATASLTPKEEVEGVEERGVEADIDADEATGAERAEAPERPELAETEREELSFSEEPRPFGGVGPETSEAVAEEERVLKVAEKEAPEEGEHEVEIEVEIEGIETEVEAEPEMAAGGASPLVGLLGDDIDSLIDSIIDDVGGGARPAPAAEAPTHIPLFSDLTAEEFIDVAFMLVRRTVKAGTVVVNEGDPGDSMFIVSTGEVEATREEGGCRVKIASLTDGDFFGEMALLSGEPRNAAVIAVKNTELLELGRESLDAIFSRHPDIEAKIRLAYDERMMRSQSAK